VAHWSWLGAIAVSVWAGCGVFRDAEVSTEPLRPLAFLAWTTPLTQTSPPGATTDVLPVVVVYADGLAIALDPAVPLGHEAHPRFLAQRLSTEQLAAMANAIDEERLQSLRPTREQRDVAWSRQQDRVVGFRIGLGTFEARDVALDGRAAPQAFEHAVSALDEIRTYVIEHGRAWQPDDLHPVPLVKGGTLVEG